MSEVYGIQEWQMIDLSYSAYRQICDDLEAKNQAAKRATSG